MASFMHEVDQNEQAASPTDVLNKMFDEFHQKTMGYVNQSQQSLQRNLQTEVHTLMSKFHARVQSQFQQQNAAINELREVARQSSRDFKQVWTAIGKINNALLLANDAKATAVQAREAAFDSAPDPCKIRIKCKQLLDKEAMETALAPWLSDAGLDGIFTLLGPEHGLSKFWSVVCSGPEAVAARRARKPWICSGALTGSDGRWWPPPRSVVRLISTYRLTNRKQIATERLGKKLFHILKSEITGQKLHLLKREGLVTVSWKPLARIEAHSDGSYTVLWDQTQLDSQKLQKAAILESLASSAGASEEGIQWSR